LSDKNAQVVIDVSTKTMKTGVVRAVYNVVAISSHWNLHRGEITTAIRSVFVGRKVAACTKGTLASLDYKNKNAHGRR
jgi:hypothetical protein